MSTVAVIGASTDRNKFGNKAVRAYKEMGWDVYPVNPRADEVEELKAYKSIADVPKPIDRILIYLPPKVTMASLDDIASAKAEEVFFNPGTESPEIIAKAGELGINAIQACSIVDIGKSPAQFP